MSQKRDTCQRCGTKLEQFPDEPHQTSLKNHYICEVCYRQLAVPVPPALEEQLEGLINRYSLKRVVQTLVNIGLEKALHLHEDWHDAAAARSWKRDAGRLGRVEDKLEN